MKHLLFTLLVLLPPGEACRSSSSHPSQDKRRTPESFFGHKVGEDRKLFTYSRCIDYLRELEKSSDRIKLIEIGQSTLKNPILMAAIGDLKDLDRQREIAKALSTGRIGEEEARELARKGKTFVLVTCNIHASEIASSQTAAELAYLALERAPKDVIFLLMPSINPDGQMMIVDWYDKYVGTEFEGGPMPWLYHHYAGHDNNRDWWAFNLAETRAVSEVYYKTWIPQVIVDHHQMGSTGARMFVPPYTDPANENVHPLVHRWLNVFGTKMAADLEASGRRGVTHQQMFTAYWPGTSIMTPWWTNQIGILTESASCRIATPITVDPGEAGDRDSRVVSPSPWKGGEWHLRDIVENQIIATFSVLETASKFREEILFNSWKMAHDRIEEGRRHGYGYKLGEPQHDWGAVRRLESILKRLNIETEESWDGRTVIPFAQAKFGLVRDLFEKQVYPGKDRPYDVSGWTLPLQMEVGVRILREREKPVKSDPKTGGFRYIQYALDPRNTESFSLANRLLKEGIAVFRASAPIKTQYADLPAGTFLLAPDDKGVEQAVKRLDPTNLTWIEKHVEGDGLLLHPVRIGLFKPWNSSMDEGWTRLVLEQFDFAYTNLDNKAIKAGKLRDSFDVIILPSISAAVITKGRADEKMPDPFPPEYRGGIGDEGVKALKEFVEQGGTVIALDESCSFAIDTWPCPVRNVLKDDKEFACPGSILTAAVDTHHPIGFGMPEKAHLYFVDSPAFATSLPPNGVGRSVVARYPEKETPLASGYLKAPEKIQGRAALVEVTIGKGRIVLFGFRPQFRAQTYGTFKLFFNAIFLSSSERAKLP